MRNLKKILALVLALVMVLSVMVTASAASFEDAESITYTEAVEVMSAIGVLSGYEAADGTFTFKPEGTLSRAEAAKIITYILTGGDLDAVETEALVNPFEDVSGWATDFIAYLASEGIVDGNGGGKYYPKNTLTGYEFAKMLLNALEIEGTYTGKEWKLNVATAAKEAGLLAGLAEGFSLKNDITREEASQIALNALKANGKTVRYYYVVDNAAASVAAAKAAKQVFAVETSAAEAYTLAALMNNASANTAKVLTDDVTSGALLSEVFGLSWTDTNAGSDEFGRPATEYWDTLTSGVSYYACYTADPVLTYDAAVKTGTIYADLGLKASKVVNWVIDGYCDPGTTANPGGTYLALTRTAVTNADYIGGNGVSIEVYYTNGVYTVVQVANYLGKVVDVVDYKAATATTNTQWAYVVIELYGTDYTDGSANPEYAYYTYYDSGMEEGDLVIVNAVNEHDGDDMTIISVEPAEIVVGTMTKYINGVSYTIDATTYAFAQKGLSIRADFLNEQAYITDGEGVVYAVTTVNEVIPTNYVYVESIQTQAYDAGSLLEGTTARASKASVVFADGTQAVIDLFIGKSSGTYYTIAPEFNAGVPTGDVEAVTDFTTYATKTTVGTWYAYEVAENGTYILSEVDATYAAVDTNISSFVEDTVYSIGGKYLTSTSVVTGLKMNAYGTYVVSSFTGLPTADLDVDNTADVLYTYAKDSNKIVNMYIVGESVATVLPDVSYGYAVQAGATTAYGTEWTFYVDGEAVTVVVSSGSVTAKNVYALTKVTTGTYAGTYTVGSSLLNASGSGYEVVVADEAYFVLGSTAYYYAEDCVVYNVSTGNYGTIDTVEVKDMVCGITTYALDNVNGSAYEIAILYIVGEAE